MNHLKVGARLGLAFAGILALMLLIVGLGVSRLSALNQETHTVTTKVYPQTELAQSSAYEVMNLARLTRNFILLTDEQLMSKMKADYDTSRTKLLDNLVKMQAAAAPVEEAKLVAEVKRASEAFLPFNDEVAKLGLANQNDEGVKLLFSERLQTQTQFLKTLSDLVAFGGAQMAAADKHADEAYSAAMTWMFVAAALSLLLAGVLGVKVSKSITAPLREAVEVANRVAAGDLSYPVSSHSTDETGLLLAALSRMQEGLSDTVGQVRSNADGVATASSQIAQGNANLSQRTEEQASALEQTAATMHSLGDTVRDNASKSQTANQLSVGASSIATHGAEQVNEVITTMRAIHDSSRKISDIIAVIDGIAFQTNILALNAAVEAARAGEQGRGFAVVASEVRSLAQRSADAAKEIKSLITRSVEQVERGTEVVDQAGRTMSEVVEAIKRSSELVGDISIASVEQSNGVAQVGQAITQMDQVTQQNAALVEESAAAAESLRNQAQQLQQIVSGFQLRSHGGSSHATAPSMTRATLRSSAASASAHDDHWVSA